MYFECRHIMPNGARCHSPALHDMNFCYFHNRIQAIAKPSRAKSHSAKAGDEPFKYPILEDRTAIQVALSDIINDLSSSKSTPPRRYLALRRPDRFPERRAQAGHPPLQVRRRLLPLQRW